MAERHHVTLARRGDILIGRVGRNLHEKVAFLRDGPYAISDCVYRLRPRTHHAASLARYLTSAEGKAALASTASGSGARHLSKAELLKMPICLDR